MDGVSVCCCVLLYYMPLGLSNGFVWQPFCLDLQNIWLLPYRENVWLPDFQRILVQVQNQCHVLSWKIKKIIYYVSSFFLGTVFGGKIRKNGALLIKGSWCNGWVKASQNQDLKFHWMVAQIFIVLFYCSIFYFSSLCFSPQFWCGDVKNIFINLCSGGKNIDVMGVWIFWMKWYYLQCNQKCWK